MISEGLFCKSESQRTKNTKSLYLKNLDKTESESVRN